MGGGVNAYTHKRISFRFEFSVSENTAEIVESIEYIMLHEQYDFEVLQVVNFGEVIHFAGIFHCKNRWTYALLPIGYSGAIMEIKPPGVELEYEIEPICEYPSETHFGDCPGLDSLKKLIKISGPGYRLGGSLEICNK